MGEPVEAGTEGWRSQLRRLARATTFEEATDAVLGPLLERIHVQLAACLDGESEALRGIVHVRPGAQYRRVSFVERGLTRPAASYAPSATTWRWIETHGAPVVIDVAIGVVDVVRDGAFERLEQPATGSIWETRREWLDRGATHVLGLPLLAEGAACGMVTVEVRAPGRVGKSPPWDVEMIDVHASVVAAASAYLTELPLRSRSAAPDALLPVVGESMGAIVDTLAVFAAQEETLLLSGPTGAGKSRLAAWVHSKSPRADGPFEVVHLATRPEGLRLAELFGWRRGAFTGATRDHSGAVRRATGGTLFLDELDKLTLDDQAGLLRLLEDNRYRPLGGEDRDERVADVRFVLGTNADLRSLVREGSFREDLYYRVHVLPVRVPGLARRRDEIGPWAEHMLQRRHLDVHPEGGIAVTPGAVNALEGHEWPGNLRQLDNVLRRAHALALAEHASSPAHLLVSSRLVERALAFEENAPRGSVLNVLHAAACAVVVEAQRRGNGGFDLDHVDAFRGLILAIAAEETGSVDAAFRLFGRDSMVEHRNHTKAYRRELSRLDALFAALGEERHALGTSIASGSSTRVGPASSDDDRR